MKYSFASIDRTASELQQTISATASRVVINRAASLAAEAAVEVAALVNQATAVGPVPVLTRIIPSIWGTLTRRAF